MSIQDEQFLKVKEVAAYLRISKPIIYRLIHSKELEAIKVGETYRVSVRSADAYLRKINTVNREEM